MQASLFPSFGTPLGADRPSRRQRRLLLSAAAPGASLAIAFSAAEPPASFADFVQRPERRPIAMAVLVALALVAHVAVVEFAHHSESHDTITPKPPITLEITRPPPPPPPKVMSEPPKPLPEARKPPPLPPKPAPRPPRVVHQTPPPARAAPAPVAPPVPAVHEDTPAPTPAPVTTAPPAPPPAAPASSSERVTEAHGRAGYLHNPPPDYPEAAQERNWQGRAMLRVHVLANGHADQVVVAQSSGHQILDDAAVRTVSRWLFAPATRGDAPIDGWANVPIDFRL